MRKHFALWSFVLLLAAFASGCNKTSVSPTPTPSDTTPTTPERTGESGISYQLLVYSFADSDSDGCGDFKGIESHLDYLKAMGVQALWLSPIHKAASYHGYDVLDYESIDPDFGTEDDFKSLVSAAHAKGIKIYLDFVLNHTSKDHPWFLDAKTGTDSEYRDYYIFSDTPKEDISNGRIAMIANEGAAGYDSGQWYSAVSGNSESMNVRFTLVLDGSGSPSTLKIEKTDDLSNSGTQDKELYLYYGDGNMEKFYSQGSNTYSLALNLSSSWGVLIRTSATQWDSYKYGAPSGKNQLSWGESLALSNSDNQDILLPDMSSTYYHSHMWTSWFADLNYGVASTCETSAAFKALTAAADKWIALGVDGFRLDAVKHIYHDADSDENPTFLKKFYDHCNSTFKSLGGDGEFYMVGEQFSEYSSVAPYYKGLPAFFEFSFWWTLEDAINNGVGSGFVGAVQSFRAEYAKYRSDYIAATKLSNHDENRAGSELGKSSAKMKLAAVVLLTASGEPYIYQGEELGYYGKKDNGDEYVRTPIMWNADGSNLADERLGDKIDRSMLSSSISVEKQESDDNSILNVYRTFGVLRDNYPSLAKGSFDYCSVSGAPESLSVYQRSLDDEKILVVHNFGSATVNVNLSNYNLENMIGSNGSASVNGNKLTLGSYSSALFLQ